MDSRVKSKSEKSICEISMEVVANVIRLSSFSIAQKSLGATNTGKVRKDLSGSGYSDMEPEKEPPVPDQFHADRRSREPQSRANRTYVIEPVESNGSTTRVIHKGRVHQVKPKKEECVDGLASEYISRMRNKLGFGS